PKLPASAEASLEAPPRMIGFGKDVVPAFVNLFRASENLLLRGIQNRQKKSTFPAFQLSFNGRALSFDGTATRNEKRRRVRRATSVLDVLTSPRSPQMTPPCLAQERRVTASSERLRQKEPPRLSSRQSQPESFSSRSCFGSSLPLYTRS